MVQLLIRGKVSFPPFEHWWRRNVQYFILCVCCSEGFRILSGQHTHGRLAFKPLKASPLDATHSLFVSHWLSRSLFSRRTKCIQRVHAYTEFVRVAGCGWPCVDQPFRQHQLSGLTLGCMRVMAKKKKKSSNATWVFNIGCKDGVTLFFFLAYIRTSTKNGTILWH